MQCVLSGWATLYIGTLLYEPSFEEWVKVVLTALLVLVQVVVFGFFIGCVVKYFYAMRLERQKNGLAVAAKMEIKLKRRASESKERLQEKKAKGDAAPKSGSNSPDNPTKTIETEN